MESNKWLRRGEVVMRESALLELLYLTDLISVRNLFVFYMNIQI